MRIVCSLKEKNKGIIKFKTCILEKFNFKKVIFEMRSRFLDHYEEFNLSDSEIVAIKELVSENYYKHGLLAAAIHTKESFVPKLRSKRLFHPVEKKNKKLTKEKILQELIFLDYRHFDPGTRIDLRAISLHVLCEAIKKIINISKAEKIDYSLYEKIFMFFRNKIEEGVEVCIVEYILWLYDFKTRLAYSGREEIDLIFSSYDPARNMLQKDNAYEEIYFLKSKYNIDINFYVVEDLFKFYNDIKSFCVDRNISFAHEKEDVRGALMISLETAIVSSRSLLDSFKSDFLKGFKEKEIKEKNKVQDFSLYTFFEYYIADNFCENKQFDNKIKNCHISPYDIKQNNIKQSMFYILTKILNKNSDLICNMLEENVAKGIEVKKDIKLYEKNNLHIELYEENNLHSSLYGPHAYFRYRLRASLNIDWKDLEKALSKAGISDAEIAFLRSLIEREDILSILRATPT